MLQILSKTNLDITLFIGNDESIHKVTGLVLGLHKKGYRCEGSGATVSTFMTGGDGNSIEGLRVRFTKSSDSGYGRFSRSFFKRKITKDGATITLDISRGTKLRHKTSVSVRIVPSSEDKRTLSNIDIISRYSRHIKTSEAIVDIGDIISSADIDNDCFSNKSSEEDNNNSALLLDTVVTRVKDLETNYKYLYPFLCVQNLTKKQSLSAITLAEFNKFAKQTDIIEEVSMPTKCARQKFIELCDIFKSNTVLNKLKANNFEFRKDARNSLSVDLFGFELINEINFKHFKYFDHPGINFCADYLDKSKTFDIIEAKVSKEIITRI